MGRPVFMVFYGESQSEAEYVIANTRLSRYRCVLRRLEGNDQRSFPGNPRFIQEILYLDKPDVIIAAGTPPRPIFASEFTAHSPSGHDVYQRFARAVAAAQQGTPFAFLFPERKMKKNGRGWYQYNPAILRATLEVSRFTGVPVLPFLWHADEATGNPHEGRLLCSADGTRLPPPDDDEMAALLRFVDITLEYHLQNRPCSDMAYQPFYRDREALNWGRYHDKGGNRKTWSPLTSCVDVPTQQLPAYIRSVTGRRSDPLPEMLRTRPQSVIYHTKSNDFRADPFGGALLAVDYLRCRNGPTEQHRHTNLVLQWEDLSIGEIMAPAQRYHAAHCPLRLTDAAAAHADEYYSLHLRDGCRYTKQKELRVFCSAADIIIFTDGIIVW